MTQSSATEHKWFGPAHRRKMAAIFVTKRVCSPPTYLTIKRKRCCSEQSVCRARVVRARGEAGVVCAHGETKQLAHLHTHGGRKAVIQSPIGLAPFGVADPVAE